MVETQTKSDTPTGQITPAQQKIARKEHAAPTLGHKIDNVTFGFMIAVAIFYDVLSFIPGINLISEIFGIGTFALWWYFSGIGLINTKKIVTWATSGFVELIPAVSALPSFTAGVIITVLLTRAEEKTGVSLTPGSASINPKNVLPFRNKNTDDAPPKRNQNVA